MKKILVLVSIALMSGCMYALAADDSANTGTTGTTTGNMMNDAQKPADNAMNQAGTAADNAANSANDQMNTTTDTMKKETTTTAKNAKTCVDDNGNTLKKGEAGFRTCMKKQLSKQQGGTMGNENTDTGVVQKHTETDTHTSNY